MRRLGHGILLELIELDVDSWLAELARYKDVPFLEEGQEQPPMPQGSVMCQD